MRFASWLRDLIVEGETPKTLYVHRKVVNHVAIRAWFWNFNVHVDDDLHCTILYSKKPVFWRRVPPITNPLTILGHDGRKVSRLGSQGAIVMILGDQPFLQDEHRRFMDAGASHDYGSYMPHVTLFYNDSVNPRLIPSYTGPIILGPQIYRTIQP